MGYNDMNKVIPVVLIASIVLSLYAYPVSAAYRREYSLKGRGTLYVMDLVLIIEDISNYGVISIYLRPDGVYAYGLTIMKDPDEEYPHMYLMLGAQDKWFNLGFLRGDAINMRLVVDLNSSQAVLFYNNSFRKYNISSVKNFEELYISSFNITGRASDYPRMNIRELKVWIANYTLNNSLIDELGNLELNLTEKGFKQILYLSGEETVLESNTTVITINPNNRLNISVNWLIIAIAITGVTILLVLIYLQSRRVPRSVNQSYP